MLLASLFFMAVTAVASDHRTADTRDNSTVDSMPSAALEETSEEEPAFFSPYRALANMPVTKKLGEIPGRLLGSRDNLGDRGLYFFLTYTSDIAGNPVGGMTPGGCTYADFFYLGCILDSEALLGIPGGSLNMSVAQADGEGLSQQNIGNQFSAQEIFAGQTFYWYQLFYEQHLFDKRVSFKIGRLSSGNDFSSSPLYWLYMNGGIDGAPQALLVNQGISYYATSTWGSSLKVHLTRSVKACVGAYQVTEGSIKGFNWDIYPNDGLLLLGQLSWSPIFSTTHAAQEKQASEEEESSKTSFATQTSKNPVAATSIKNFQGHYWMGGYYSTSVYNEALSQNQPPGSYGFYWHADQTIYKPDAATDAGLVIWTALTLSPQQDIAFMPFQANAGAIYTGLIPGRRNDATIFGAAYGSISPIYATNQQNEGGGYPVYELVYELGYRINFTPATYIQPDIQWIINPGGTGSIPNALVIGAQMGTSF